jgi:hypothetical protein
VIRVYDEAGNVIETHDHKSDFVQDNDWDSNGITATERKRRLF